MALAVSLVLCAMRRRESGENITSLSEGEGPPLAEPLSTRLILRWVRPSSRSMKPPRATVTSATARRVPSGLYASSESGLYPSSGMRALPAS